jgi:hypothetical protein
LLTRLLSKLSNLVDFFVVSSGDLEFAVTTCPSATSFITWKDVGSPAKLVNVPSKLLPSATIVRRFTFLIPTASELQSCAIARKFGIVRSFSSGVTVGISAAERSHGLNNNIVHRFS